MKGQIFNAPLNGISAAPFYAAANRVLLMYSMRQARASSRCPADSPAEIEWGSEQLFRLADAAAYAGSKEAKQLRDAATFWKQYSKKPELFPVEIEA
ncbi:hypothetical protein ITX54_02750 [Rouxiella silvae]|uniref:Uncharacterized protein n=1 Tax=Rouxiella silvae TaxID=1646373 RepID=A0AA40WZS4_9GAMM|nr:hypothetical protein [Rouxiella silvae]MBF6635584.1 hypothetical protein [Rouxiella silvae]